MSEPPGMKYHDPVTGEPLTFEQVRAQIVDLLQGCVRDGFLEGFKMDADGNGYQVKLTDAGIELGRQGCRDGLTGLDGELTAMMLDYRDGLLP